MCRTGKVSDYSFATAGGKGGGKPLLGSNVHTFLHLGRENGNVYFSEIRLLNLCKGGVTIMKFTANSSLSLERKS